MKRASIKTALLALSVLGGIAAPLAAFADTSTSTTTRIAMAGIYDGADQFKDATGHPIAGWQYLSYAANGNG
jgi:hypothetical protein